MVGPPVARCALTSPAATLAADLPTCAARLLAAANGAMPLRSGRFAEVVIWTFWRAGRPRACRAIGSGITGWSCVATHQVSAYSRLRHTITRAQGSYQPSHLGGRRPRALQFHTAGTVGRGFLGRGGAVAAVTIGVADWTTRNRECGKRSQITNRARSITFPTVELLRKVITPKRWELMRAMTRGPAGDPRSRAATFGRDVKSVHGDVSSLSSGRGVIERTGRPRAFPYDEVRVDFVLRRRPRDPYTATGTSPMGTASRLATSSTKTDRKPTQGIRDVALCRRRSRPRGDFGNPADRPDARPPQGRRILCRAACRFNFADEPASGFSRPTSTSRATISPTTSNSSMAFLYQQPGDTAASPRSARSWTAAIPTRTSPAFGAAGAASLFRGFFRLQSSRRVTEGGHRDRFLRLQGQVKPTTLHQKFEKFISLRSVVLAEAAFIVHRSISTSLPYTGLSRIYLERSLTSSGSLTRNLSNRSCIIR